MITEAELSQKFRIILSKQHPRVEFQPAFYDEPMHNRDFIEVARQVRIVSESFDMLCLLYSQCTDDLKQRFMQILFSTPIGLQVFNRGMLLHAAFELGGLTALLPFLEHPLWIVIAAWQVLNERLTVHSKRFSDSDLDLAFSLAHSKVDLRNEEKKLDVPFYAFLIVGKIHTIRYLRLKDELFQGENPEINTDKEVLISRLKNLGFRDEIIGALRAVDLKIFSAHEALDFKGCMDLIRTVYEEIVEDAAKKVAEKKNKPAPDYPKKAFKPWNDYLRVEGILKAGEAELTQKLYSYISEAGSHQLGSAPEQARVSRSLVIEMSLLIMGRVELL